MIIDRSGVIDMLVKLAVCFLILCLIMSLVAGAVFDSEGRLSVQALRSETASLCDDIQATYRGNIIIHRCDLPTRQTLLVGGEGEDTYTIRLCVDGEIVKTLCITSPTAYVNGSVTELSGDAVVVLDGRASGDASWGRSGIKVTIL